MDCGLRLPPVIEEVMDAAGACMCDVCVGVNLQCVFTGAYCLGQGEDTVLTLVLLYLCLFFFLLLISW